ncbi:hypothetical protein ADN00_12790 [Ornatilinea apprima]|uniref:Uncharacterized protein n=1 Tax=Ornatilinea apprima TaxID=1134406 RepID=A0A0P6X7X3_9CHLR|nr:hypothetical protein [Ornatilinea apprima]KPL75518.1 hypothetical protein ADN00_12790 [Ornatilinea apprima]
MKKPDEQSSPEFKGKKEDQTEKPVFHVFDRGMSDDEFVDAIEKIVYRMKEEKRKKEDAGKSDGVGAAS